jgi:hypothetical protein
MRQRQTPNRPMGRLVKSTVNIIETDRLLLRPFRMDDADADQTLLGDHIEVTYKPTGADTSVRRTMARLAGYERYQATQLRP